MLRILVGLSCLLAFAVASGAPAEAYYSLRDIDAGALSIHGLHVTRVQILNTGRNPSADEVSLKFSGGTLSLTCGPARQVCLSGALSIDPAILGDIKGSFSWNGKGITDLKLTHFRAVALRPSLRPLLFGGEIHPISSATLESTSAVEFGPSNTGELRIVVNCKLTGARINLADLPITANLSSISPTKFSLDIANGNLSLVSGVLSTQTTSTTVHSPISKLFPKLLLSEGEVSLTNLAIRAKSNTVSVGTLVISRLSLVSSDFPTIPVAAAARLIATDIAGTLDSSPQLAATAGDPSIGAVRVIPNSTEVINLLNQHWVKDPEVLLPTADSNVKFISLSTLDTFYTSITTAQQEPQNFYRIHLAIQKGIINATSTEVIPVAGEGTESKSSPKPPPKGLAKICVVLEGDFAETAASIAITLVLTEGIPAIREAEFGKTATLAEQAEVEAAGKEAVAWLNKINMRLAPAMTMAAYGATKLLKDTAIAKAAKSIIKDAHNECEVLLGDGPSSRAVELPFPADDPTRSYNQQMLDRYARYLREVNAAGVDTSSWHSVFASQSASMNSYNRFVDARSTAWISKQREDIEKVQAEEKDYQRASARRQEAVAKGNAQTSSQAVQQGQLDEARRRAIADTPIVSVPTPQPQSGQRFYMNWIPK